MAISTTFANALSGLNVTRRMAEIASNNLANALTEGYGRQQVDVSSAVLAGAGVGSRVEGINRAAAPDLTASRRQADGDAATIGPQSDALARLGRALGEATDDESLFRRLETYEASLRQLAESPESEPRQLQAINAAKDLTSYMNTLSREAQTVRENADAAIAAQVGTVNANLTRIDQLDTKIVKLQTGGRNTAGLLDERERLIDEINAIIPVRVHGQSDGSVHLTTEQGLFLLSETPRQLEFINTATISPALAYDPLGGGGLSGLTLSGIDITVGSNHPQRIVEGALAGNFAVRDQIAVDFNAQLDQFAADLIARYEDPAVDPTLTAGDPGLFTDNSAALDPLNIEGLAGRISVNALADPAAGGLASRLRDGLQSAGPGPTSSDIIPRALLDTLRTPRPATAIPGISGNLSASQMLAEITEYTGTQRTDAEAEFALRTGTRETLALSEGEAIGVNNDAELQSLIEIEQAYSANLQVIQAASRMLQQLTEIR